MKDWATGSTIRAARTREGVGVRVVVRPVAQAGPPPAAKQEPRANRAQRGAAQPEVVQRAAQREAVRRVAAVEPAAQPAAVERLAAVGPVRPMVAAAQVVVARRTAAARA